MKRRIALLLMFGVLPWADLYAQSQTATATFKVSAQVNALCSVTATDLNFGAYTQTALLGQTTLRATCTPQTTYQIGLNGGVSGDINKRQMKSGTTNTLNYQLYQDTSRNVIWGNTQNTDTVTGVPGTGIEQLYTVYGSIAAAQNVPAGAYEDTVTVTIFY